MLQFNQCFITVHCFNCVCVQVSQVIHQCKRITTTKRKVKLKLDENNNKKYVNLRYLSRVSLYHNFGMKIFRSSVGTESLTITPFVCAFFVVVVVDNYIIGCKLITKHKTKAKCNMLNKMGKNNNHWLR